MHVLQFLREKSPRQHFRSLAENVYLCAKPLDFERSEAQLASSGKKVAKRTKCPALDCPKLFKRMDKLLAHMHEHPHLSALSMEQWDEMMSSGAEPKKPPSAAGFGAASSSSGAEPPHTMHAPVVIKRPRDE